MPVGEPPEVELKDLRVAFATTFPGFPIAAAIGEAVKELADKLEPLCAAVEEKEISVHGKVLGGEQWHRRIKKPNKAGFIPQ